MTTHLTDQQLADIEARANVATDGPWERYEKYGPDFFACTTGSHLRGVGTFNFGDGTDAEADEEFVKHAVQDVRALVAEVRRLQVQRRFLLGQLAKKDAASGEADRKLREFLSGEEQPTGADTVTTTPADELRTAAQTLRKLVGQATAAPWVTTWREQQYHLDGNTDEDLSPIAEWTYAIATWEPKASEQRAECDTANADYIAAVHPGVGAALAELLATAAEYVAEESPAHPTHLVRARAVARAVNAARPAP